MEQKIYVNCRFLTQKITGVQRFAIEICKKLKELYGDRYVFVAPDDIKDESMAKALDVVHVGYNRGHLWEQIDLPIYLTAINTPPC